MNWKATLKLMLLLGFVCITGNAHAVDPPFPWAKAHDTNPTMTTSQIRQDKSDTIGGENVHTLQISNNAKDLKGDTSKLGYSSPVANETKEFSTELDLTGEDADSLRLAVLADDVAVIKIYAYDESAAGNKGDQLHTFSVRGGALWNPASYKEDSYILSSGHKYVIDLHYKNNVHWTDGDLVDVDGVSLYKLETGEVSLDIVTHYAPKGSKSDAVRMDIVISGIGKIKVKPSHSGDNTGRITIWNWDLTVKLSEDEAEFEMDVAGTEFSVSFWVQGVATSSVVSDVTVTAKLYDAGNNLQDTDSDTVTVFKIDVTHIKFDHATGHAADGIDIREDATTDISVPEWVKDGQNKPAAYTKSTDVTIKARLTVSPNSITSAKVRATTADAILGNLGEQTITFASGVSTPEYVSFTPANASPNAVDKGTVSWQWRAKHIQGSDSLEADINPSGPHPIYTVLDTPVAPHAEPWTLILGYSCDWADGDATKSAACASIRSNGFASHYTWNINCQKLSSDFVRLVKSLGINASQHRWASMTVPFAVDVMNKQRTREFDPVGPTHDNGVQEWYWHQWAEAEGSQQDPSAAASRSGTWGGYEDYFFTHYQKVTQVQPLQTEWVANQNGQIAGCEAPANRIYSATPPTRALGGPNPMIKRFQSGTL